jgi:3-mercaptopyruvate sulfurtransferase SseA
VVIVDEKYDATWLWWAFCRYGKSNVQVLDGGLKAWKNQQLPLKSGPLRPVQKLIPGSFTAVIGADFPVADLAMVLASQHDSSIQLWDTRELHEWDGRTRVRGAMRAGRIAWANHLHWNRFRHDGRPLSTFRTNSCIDRLVAERSISIKKTIFFIATQEFARQPLSSRFIDGVGIRPNFLTMRALGASGALCSSHRSSPIPIFLASFPLILMITAIPALEVDR